MMLARCISQAVEGCGSYPQRILNAASFVRRMRGGAQSSLLRASDGEMYVVKLQGNPQGPDVLAHEALGSWLAGRLGLPTPEWGRISIDDGFIDGNPEIWFETPSGRVRPAAGIHYASRLVEAGRDGSVYETLPRSWFARIENRPDFLGMLVLDLWSGHADNRQACFVQEAGERGLRAVFLDHGHMFGGPGAKVGGGGPARPEASFFLDRGIYGGLWSDSQGNEWLKKIYSIRAEAAYTFVSSIPLQWSSAPMELVVSNLLDRRQTLEQVIARVRAHFEAPFPMRKPIQRVHDSPKFLRISGDPLRAFPGAGNRLCVGGSR